MQTFNIHSSKDELIIRLNKSEFPIELLLKIAYRLRAEYLAQKAGFTEEIMGLEEEINQKWWDKNEDEFLKDIKK